MKTEILTIIIMLILAAVLISGCSQKTATIAQEKTSQPQELPKEAKAQQQQAETPPQQQEQPQEVVAATPQQQTPKSYNVEISGFAFQPQQITIKTGDIVVWTNQDSVSHTIKSDTGNEISSSSLSKGATYSHTFTQPGTYDYHCSIHPSMQATVVVE